MTSVPGWHFCLKCGSELPGDALYCPLCGHQVSGAAPRHDYDGPVAIVAGEQLPLASVGKRLGAMLVDWMIFVAVGYGLFLVIFVALIIGSVDVDDPNAEPDFPISARVFVAVSLGASFVALLIWWSFDSFGWSPGKAATSVRTVRLDGRRPGLVHGLVRYSMRSVSFFAFGLGYFWAIWDKRNQTWHDKLAGTVVVRAQPLQKQFPDRRPDPLVVRTRVWWFAAVATLLLTASMAMNVWWVSNIDGDLFDSEQFNPRRFEEDRRISHAPDATEALLVRFED